MTIATILQSKGYDVVSVSPAERVRDALELLNAQRIGAVLVVEGGEVLGVLSERDIVRSLHEDSMGLLERSVTACMTSPVVTVTPEDSINDAMALMTRRRIRHLPVVAGGQLIGLVSIGDLVKSRIDAAEREAELLKEYIATS